MPRLTKDQIVTAVYRQINEAEGYDSDELSQLREEALDYYYSRPGAAPSAPGRSALQSSDVADMLEAVVAQIMPAVSSDDVIQFQPMGEDDVEQARAESRAVNWVVMEQNNGHYEIQQAVRDALLLRNGIIKVYLDERTDTTAASHERLTELEYGQLMGGAVQNLNAVGNGYTVETTNEEDGFYDVRVTSKTTKRKVCSQAVDPCNFMWQQNWDSIYLEDCRFVAEYSQPTRSELIDQGYSKTIVNKLKPGGNNVRSGERSRNQHHSNTNYKGETPAEDLLDCYECYYRLDADGDGQAELLKIVVCDKTILEMQDMEYVPYASGTPFLQPHRFNGLGLFDKLRNIQDAKTATMRQLLDNQNHANNARVIVLDGMVNADDVTNSRPGGVVRATAPGAVEPFPFTDIGPSCQNTLNYLDKVRSERGGASLDLQSAELQLAGETAHGVERQMSSKEQLAAMMCRTLAETLLRTTYQLVHEALRMYRVDPLNIDTGTGFEQADPSQWRPREQVKIMAGLSLAERGRKAAAMDAITTNQSGLTQTGMGFMASPQDVYNAAIDSARASGIQNPERYYTDPSSQEAQQAQQQQSQQAQEQKQYQDQLLQMQMQIEDRKANNADAKVMEDGRQFDENLRYEYWKVTTENEIKEADMASDLALELVKNESQAGTGEAAG